MTGRFLLSSVLVLFLASCLLQAQQQGQANEQKTTQTNKAKKESPKPARKRVVTDLSGFDLLESSKVKKQTMVVGATRGGQAPVALAPRLGKVLSQQPTFVWQYGGKTEKFNFVLRGDSREEIFRAEVKGSQYTYPAGAPSLEPGKTYFWTIQPSLSLFGVESAPVGFLVVSKTQGKEIKEELGQINSDDPYETGLAEARLYTDHRLWYDAVTAYTHLIARYPHRAELHENRGMIFAQLDTTKELAERDFALADELREKTPP